MSKWLVAVAGVVFVLVIGANPQAQSVSEDPIIPLPIAATEAPSADTAVAKTEPATRSGAMEAKPGDAAGAATVSPAPFTKEVRGSIAQPRTAFEICYLFGYPEGASPSEPEKAVSLVLWKAIGEGTKFDVAELRERISLHPKAPALTDKGVYALQADYKVTRVSLSAQETARLFELVRQGDGAALVSDNLWKSKVHSAIREVEWETERPKALRKLAADKARAARKATARAGKTSAPKSAGKATKAKATAKKSAGTSGAKKGAAPAKKKGKATRGMAVVRH